MVQVLRLLLEVEDKKVFARCASCGGFLDAPQSSSLGRLTLTNAALVESTLLEAKRQKIALKPAALVSAVLHKTSMEAERKMNEYVPREERADLPHSIEEKIEKLRPFLERQHQAKKREEILHFLLDRALEEYAPTRSDIAAEVKKTKGRHVPEKLEAAETRARRI